MPADDAEFVDRSLSYLLFLFSPFSFSFFSSFSPFSRNIFSYRCTLAAALSSSLSLFPSFSPFLMRR